MPTVPTNTSNVGPSLLDAKPSKGNLLMAAAIQSAGRLSKSAQPNPSRPHPANKKVKVMK